MYLLIGMILILNEPYMPVRKLVPDHDACMKLGQKFEQEIPKVTKDARVVWRCEEAGKSKI